MPADHTALHKIDRANWNAAVSSFCLALLWIVLLWHMAAESLADGGFVKNSFQKLGGATNAGTANGLSFALFGVGVVSTTTTCPPISSAAQRGHGRGLPSLAAMPRQIGPFFTKSRSSVGDVSSSLLLKSGLIMSLEQGGGGINSAGAKRIEDQQFEDVAKIAGAVKNSFEKYGASLWQDGYVPDERGPFTVKEHIAQKRNSKAWNWRNGESICQDWFAPHVGLGYLGWGTWVLRESLKREECWPRDRNILQRFCEGAIIGGFSKILFLLIVCYLETTSSISELYFLRSPKLPQFSERRRLSIAKSNSRNTVW